MSTKSRRQKAKRRSFESLSKYNGGPDKQIKNWQLLDIHEIPTVWPEGYEVDFWCSNGIDVYLLRLRKSLTERYLLSKPSENHVVYLIGELDFDEINNSLLEKVIEEFERRWVSTGRIDSLL